MNGDKCGLKYFQTMSTEALPTFLQMRNKSFEGNHETLATTVQGEYIYSQSLIYI